MFRTWFIKRGVYVKPIFGGWAAVWHTRAGSLLDDLMTYGPVVTWRNLVWMLREDKQGGEEE